MHTIAWLHNALHKRDGLPVHGQGVLVLVTSVMVYLYMARESLSSSSSPIHRPSSFRSLKSYKEKLIFHISADKDEINTGNEFQGR